MDAGRISTCAIIETSIGRHRGARILHEISALRMQERSLGLPEIREMRLVYDTVRDGPVVCEVQLLVTLLRSAPKFKTSAPPAWKRE